MPKLEKLSCVYRNENISVSIHYEVDESGYIKRLACDRGNDNPWQIQLDIITRQAEGSTMEEILSLLLQRESSDADPVIDLPFMLLRKSLLKYRGVPRGHINILKKETDQLVCRCFGVYSGRIEKIHLEKNRSLFKRYHRSIEGGRRMCPLFTGHKEDACLGERNASTIGL